jgi:hypothetical protein
MPVIRPGMLKHTVFCLVPPLFYWFTLAPTIGFGDTAILVDMIQQGIVNAQVNSHPLTVWVGMLLSALVPTEDLAFRANLLSFLFGSCTIILFYSLLYRETSNYKVAVATSLALMVSHAMWWHSTIVENYAISAFLTVSCLVLWWQFRRTGREKNLYLLCVLGGFSLLNHVQMAFICLGVAVTGCLYAINNPGRRLQVLVRCLASASVGLSPWFILVFLDGIKAGSLTVAIKNAFLGNFSGTFFSGGFGASLLDTAYIFWFQSPACLMLALGFTGNWLRLRQAPNDPSTWGILTAFVVNTINFAFYATWDKFAFLLVSFVILFYFAGIALKALLQRVEGSMPDRWALYVWLLFSLIVGPVMYANIGTWGQSADSIWNARYNNRYSENLYLQSEYIINPNKRHYFEVENFSRLLFEKLPEDAIFLDDDSRTYYPLADYYQRYYRLRPDISIVLVNSWGIANWGLGADSVKDLIARAYQFDKPFFVATLQSPTAGFIEAAKKYIPIRFEPFDLGEGRWVYRLITQHENRGDVVQLPSGFSALNMDAPAGYFDLSLRNLLFFTTVTPSVQELSSFYGDWHGGDHIFFNSEKPGGLVEIGLTSTKAIQAELFLEFTSAPDFSEIKIEIADKSYVVDLYSPTVWPKELALGNINVQPGITKLTLRIAGKNPKSSGYKFALDGLRYKQTENP